MELLVIMHTVNDRIKPPGAYLPKRVLGAGAYSRGGLIREWGLFIQVNSRVGAFFKGISEQIKNIFIYIIFSTNYILCQYRLYYKSCIP